MGELSQSGSKIKKKTAWTKKDEENTCHMPRRHEAKNQVLQLVISSRETWEAFLIRNSINQRLLSPEWLRWISKFRGHESTWVSMWFQKRPRQTERKTSHLGCKSVFFYFFFSSFSSIALITDCFISLSVLVLGSVTPILQMQFNPCQPQPEP